MDRKEQKTKQTSQHPRKPKPTLSSEIELIYKVGLEISAELDLKKLLTLIIEYIQHTLRFQNCSIMLKEGDNLVIRAASEYPGDILGKTVPFGQGVTGRCASEKKEIRVADSGANADYISLSKKKFHSELAIPILFAGNLLGVVNVENTRKNAYTERDLRILKILSSQVAVAIHNARVHSQLKLVQDIGIKLVSITNLDELLASIVSETQSILHLDSCAIFLAAGEDLVLKAVTREFPRETIGLKIPIGKGVTGRCAAGKKTVNIGNVPEYPGYIPSGIAGIQSEIASPILFENRLLGVLTVESKRLLAFDEDDIRLLSILGSQIAVAIHNSRLYAELEEMAVTDPLTGLYNQRQFYVRLASEMVRAARYHHPLTLILIDLDDFKPINDAHGHIKGDEVLRLVARAISQNIRRDGGAIAMKDIEIDIVARYGGDEFFVILPETELAGARETAERLRKVLTTALAGTLQSLKGNVGPVKMTASFGITAFHPGENRDEFIRRADQAMYRAKGEGKNRIAVIE